MAAYYNENDVFAAAWLRELIRENLIADGEVDERSIEDVTAADLRGFTQVHLFAGIGGWSYALRLARWPDDRAVWTGSCPCQPFSAAGKRQGTADKRHLWPEMRRLVAECAPSVVFGEQVASRDGRIWLAGVRTDLEALGYGVGAADLCAAGVGAPHIRQRLYWVADSQHAERWPECEIDADAHRRNGLGGRSYLSGVGEPNGAGLQQRDLAATPARQRNTVDAADRAGVSAERVGDTGAARLQERPRAEDGRGAIRFEGAPVAAPGAWAGGEFIHCADGKARRVESPFLIVVDGLPGSLGGLCSEDRSKIEAEIDAYGKGTGRDGAEDVHNLQQTLLSSAESVWRVGKRAMLLEEAILLAFLCQLSEQRWAFSQGTSRESTEISRGALRMLWSDETTACPSHRRELVEQRAVEPTNALYILSSILARYASAAWDSACQRNARTHPLAVGVPNRVGTLRGAGNAIVPQVAAEFIRAYQLANTPGA